MGRPIGFGIRTAPKWWSTKVPPPKNIAIAVAATCAVAGISRMMILNLQFGSMTGWLIAAALAAAASAYLPGEPARSTSK